MEQNNSSQFTRLTNDNHLLPSNDRNKIFLDYSTKSDNILQERFTQQTRIDNNIQLNSSSSNYYQSNQPNFPQTLFENFPQQTRLNSNSDSSKSYIPNPSSSNYPILEGSHQNIQNTYQFSKKQRNSQESNRQPNSNHKNPFTLLQNSSQTNPFPDMKPINTRDINFD